MRIDELRAGLQSFLADAARSSYSLLGARIAYAPYPQGAQLPLATITRLPSPVDNHRFGTRAYPLEVDFQIDVWSSSGIAEAEEGLSKIISDLDGYSGLLGGVSIEGAKMLSLNVEQFEADAGPKGLWHASADFRFTYQP